MRRGSPTVLTRSRGARRLRCCRWLMPPHAAGAAEEVLPVAYARQAITRSRGRRSEYGVFALSSNALDELAYQAMSGLRLIGQEAVGGVGQNMDVTEPLGER